MDDKNHEELKREFEKIRELPAFQGHDPELLSVIKIKNIIRNLRQKYCENCTHEQLRFMGRDHVERLLAKTEI
jgi:hypothetical protein